MNVKTVIINATRNALLTISDITKYNVARFHIALKSKQMPLTMTKMLLNLLV